MSASATTRAQRIVHLASRFLTSLHVRPLDAATIASVMDALEPGERRVWESMSRADQAESVAVARQTELALSGTADGADARWTAAALLHDAGKQLSGYTTIGRAIVTAIATMLGNARVRSWADSGSSVRARMGRYVAHDDLGATRLQDAGARPEVIAWAAAHHRPDRWAGTGIPLAVCRVLAAADGEPVRDEDGG
jgi:HD domain